MEKNSLRIIKRKAQIINNRSKLTSVFIPSRRDWLVTLNSKTNDELIRGLKNGANKIIKKTT